ncbi:MAG: DUF4384 domain-containing protein [Bryobacteraceae bacterium]
MSISACVRMIAAAGLCVAVLRGGAAQFRSLTPTAHKIEIQLERAAAGGWLVVDPALVLDSGDRVRFRARPTFDGYLYVLNRGSSGEFALLFPQGSDSNRVIAQQEYTIPAQAGSFQITGAPGFETLYWIISPAPLGPKRESAPPPEPERPSRSIPKSSPPVELIPRCRDEIFRARGDCVDETAGPRVLTVAAPEGWNLSLAKSRELRFSKSENHATVSSTKPLTEPVIYEYRLAHR